MRSSARTGRYRDQATASSLLHPRKDAFDRQERRRQVAVDRRSPTLLRYLFQWSRFREAAAGIGDENVNRTERAFHLTPHRFDVLEARHIAHDLNHGSTSLLNGGVHRCERRSVPAVNRDFSAFGGKQASDRRANTARASRDERDSISKVLHRYPHNIHFN